MSTSAAGPGRRAPRLAPDEYLAPFITRRGRFRRIDPLRSRPRPTWPRIIGGLGWALLLGGSLAKALRSRRRTEEVEHPPTPPDESAWDDLP